MVERGGVRVAFFSISDHYDYWAASDKVGDDMSGRSSPSPRAASTCLHDAAICKQQGTRTLGQKGHRQRVGWQPSSIQAGQARLLSAPYLCRLDKLLLCPLIWLGCWLIQRR